VFLYFFFQAEDGIRDFHVTGVQTCALPISPHWCVLLGCAALRLRTHTTVKGRDGTRRSPQRLPVPGPAWKAPLQLRERFFDDGRSEERRVGKECRSR